jgi:hypothetical protein
MANTQLTDLVVIGRGGTSYFTTVSDLKLSIFDGEQSANDDRYVLVDGDTMTGFLTLHSNPVDPFHAATKKYIDDIVGTDGGLIPDINGNSHQIGTLDDRYVEIAGDQMDGALLLHADPGVPMQAATKQYVDAGDEALATSIEALDGKLDVEIQDRTNADTALDDKINDETARAEQAESDINERIDLLKLDDLSDVVVAGASAGQAVVWNGTNWVAETVTTDGALVFKGTVDLTDYSSAPAVTAADAGDLYVNTTAGAVDVAYGTGVTNSVQNAVGDEMVVVDGSGNWLYVGQVGGNGLSPDYFNAANVEETEGSKGELAYNATTGVFTFTKVDLDSRVPMDLSTLNALPVPTP